jgi:hypothetical protein
MSKDIRTFKKGEAVILYDGSIRRSSIELAEIAEDCWYGADTVLITFGHFNTRANKSSVHKAPATLKFAIKKARL